MPASLFLPPRTDGFFPVTRSPNSAVIVMLLFLLLQAGSVLADNKATYQFKGPKLATGIYRVTIDSCTIKKKLLQNKKTGETTEKGWDGVGKPDVRYRIQFKRPGGWRIQSGIVSSMTPQWTRSDPFIVVVLKGKDNTLRVTLHDMDVMYDDHIATFDLDISHASLGVNTAFSRKPSMWDRFEKLKVRIEAVNISGHHRLTNAGLESQCQIAFLNPATNSTVVANANPRASFAKNSMLAAYAKAVTKGLSKKVTRKPAYPDPKETLGKLDRATNPGLYSMDKIRTKLIGFTAWFVNERCLGRDVLFYVLPSPPSELTAKEKAHGVFGGRSSFWRGQPIYDRDIAEGKRKCDSEAERLLHILNLKSHPGAHYAGRSTGMWAYHNNVHYPIGQQVTYTRSGKLITPGNASSIGGSGTPDLYITGMFDGKYYGLDEHIKEDKKPWDWAVKIDSYMDGSFLRDAKRSKNVGPAGRENPLGSMSFRRLYLVARPPNRSRGDVPSAGETIPPGFKPTSKAEQEATQVRGREIQESLRKDEKDSLKEGLKTETNPAAREIVEERVKKLEQEERIRKSIDDLAKPKAPAVPPTPPVKSTDAYTDADSQESVDEYENTDTGGVDEYE